MDTVRLLYMRQARIDSAFLRAVMWSPWSHVAIVTPDATAIQATFFGRGVREVPLIGLLQHASNHEMREFRVPDAAAGFSWARSQIGRPYDTWGVIGLGFHRGDWQEDDAWFCSELAEAFLEACGLRRFILGAARRVTPQHSWMVA